MTSKAECQNDNRGREQMYKFRIIFYFVCCKNNTFLLNVKIISDTLNDDSYTAAISKIIGIHGLKFFCEGVNLIIIIFFFCTELVL